MHKLIPCTLILIWLTSCTGHVNDPPALPEEPVIIPAFLEEFQDTSTLDSADILECPAAGTGYRRRTKKAKVLTVSTPPHVSESQVATVTVVESTITSNMPPKKIKPINQDQLITKANAEARMSPVPEGYVKGQALYIYPYLTGKIYDILTNPIHATRIAFPPGEKLATKPTINGDEWALSTAQVGPEQARVDLLIVQPKVEGVRHTLILDMESGLTFVLNLVPAKTAMLSVTWELPQENVKLAFDTSPPTVAPLLPAKSDLRQCGEAKTGMLMPIELAQFHAGYKIEVRGTPAFTVLHAFDDGKKVLIRLKAISGNAPVVYAYKSDGSRGLVQFSPYYVPNDPAKGLYIIVESLWPRLELASVDGGSVHITRVDTTIPVVEALRKP